MADPNPVAFPIARSSLCLLPNAFVNFFRVPCQHFIKSFQPDALHDLRQLRLQIEHLKTLWALQLAAHVSHPFLKCLLTGAVAWCIHIDI